MANSNGTDGYKGLRVLQIILTLVGTINSVLTLVHAITSHLSVGFIVVGIAEVFAFVSIILYAGLFYKRGTQYFQGIIFTISVVILLVAVTASEFFVAEILYTMTYGLILVFGVKLANRNYASKVVAIACALSIAACIVSTVNKGVSAPSQAPSPAIIEEVPLPDDMAEDLPEDMGDGPVIPAPSSRPEQGETFDLVAKYASSWCLPLMIGTLALSYQMQSKRKEVK